MKFWGLLLVTGALWLWLRRSKRRQAKACEVAFLAEIQRANRD